jgi:hypothetical protein
MDRRSAERNLPSGWNFRSARETGAEQEREQTLVFKYRESELRQWIFGYEFHSDISISVYRPAAIRRFAVSTV